MGMRMSVQEYKQIAKGSKFKAKPVILDGIRFDSKAEAEFYQLLKADPSVFHIDVHPTVTLPGGIRFKPDFMIFCQGPKGQQGVECVEVKGAMLQDFRRMRKLFDQCHPCAPLKVMRKTRKGWEAI